MRLIHKNEMKTKEERMRKVEDLTAEDVNKIVYMDMIGVQRRLIAKTYKLKYSDLLTVLPTSNRTD